jgi:hypothetical protein
LASMIAQHLTGCLFLDGYGAGPGSWGGINLELDKAFQFAVTLAWDDLMKTSELSSARVEYQCEPGTSLDHVSVWSSKAWGYHDLVCDYWTRTSPTHPSSVHFRNEYYSDTLAETLEFVMKNQDQFTRPSDACRHGLVLIYTPSGAERTEAKAWREESMQFHSLRRCG